MDSTLLIVDDIQGVHEMLDIVFEDSGYQVEHALAATEALEICRQKDIAVALVDIGLPDMDGLQVLDAMKQFDPLAVVILMTASDAKAHIISALRAGAFDYVEKPFEEEDLRERVGRAFTARARALEATGGVSIKPEEVERTERERRQLAKEVQTLRKQLADRDARLEEWMRNHRDAERRLAEVEIKEGALKTMESALHERLEKLKKLQPQRLTRPSFPVKKPAAISADEIAQLEKLSGEIDQREKNLKEREQHIAERETFLQQSEESLFEKGQRLQEVDAELEQMREDLEAKGARQSVSPEERDEIEGIREELKRKEEELHKLEGRLHQKEKTLRKADMLVKARENYLAQTEKILFGDQQDS